ncbi:MAG: HAMP domain-containing histidine kinase [Chloroflexi bacterium]|nr:HAMP domain-containing histidine kinase [Chloroflexota bacterium]
MTRANVNWAVTRIAPRSLFSIRPGRGYKITVAFFLLSAIALVATFFLTSYFAEQVGRDSVIQIEKEIAESDAQLISDIVVTVLEGSQDPEVDAISSFISSLQDNPGALASIIQFLGGKDVSGKTIIEGMIAYLIETTEDPLNLIMDFIGEDGRELLTPTGVVDYSLIDQNGHASFTTGSGLGYDDEVHHFETLSRIGTYSYLEENVQYVDRNGEVHIGSLVNTYIPLTVGGEDPQTYALKLRRDATENLVGRIKTVKDSTLKITMSITTSILLVIGFAIFLFERQLRGAHDTVLRQQRVLTERLDEENIQLTQVNQSKDDFLSSLSHELKTPLTSVVGFTQILMHNKEGSLTPLQLDQLSIIRRNADHLNVMLNDLLDLSRIQRGEFEINKEVFHVDVWLEEIIDSFAPAIENRSQQIDCHIELETAKLIADRVRVSQVISNLVSNASKYSSDGSTIRVSAKVELEWLEIQIKDQGIGIAESDLGNVFLLFYRSRVNQRTTVAGTGIGLYVTKQIVELHEGTIDIQSVLGEGTTMTVRFLLPSEEQIVAAEMEAASASPFGNRLAELE